MTKTLALAALVAGSLFAGSTLQAQDSTNTPPAGAPGMRARQDFAKELNLTDAQKPKFKEIMQGAMEKRKALREDTSLSAEDKKAKAKELREGMQAKMKEILTPEQLTKWQAMQKNRGPGGPGGKPEKKAKE